MALRSISVDLELGRFGFDISSRPLTMALVEDDDVATVVAHRPAIIQIREQADGSGGDAGRTVRAVVTQFAGPVVFRTGSAVAARDGLRAGAVAIHDPTGLADPQMLSVIVDAGASVIIGCPVEVTDPVSFLRERIGWANASGISRNKIMVVSPFELVESLTALGVAVMIQTAHEPEAQGIHVKAVMAGARIVAGRNVRATRRTIDTVGELLARRHAAQ